MDHSNLPETAAPQATDETGIICADEDANGVNTPDKEFLLRQFDQFADTLPTELYHTEAEQRKVTNEALELFEGLAPANALEGSLARQMVMTHMAAMYFMEKANSPDLEEAWQDRALKHAQSLMSLFLRQHDAFRKTRSKGEQRIIVEKVQVANGGQAFVGNSMAPGSHPVQTNAAPDGYVAPAPAQAETRRTRAETAAHDYHDLPFSNLV